MFFVGSSGLTVDILCSNALVLFLCVKYSYYFISVFNPDVFVVNCFDPLMGCISFTRNDITCMLFNHKTFQVYGHVQVKSIQVSFPAQLQSRCFFGGLL